MTLCKKFLLIFAMFTAIPVRAAVDPQPTDGIRQIMVKSGDEIDVIMSQVSVIEGNMPTPLDPNQASIITIDQPGSYILTGSKTGGTIEITTSNVCLDLNGWTVEGTADGTPIILIDDSFVTVKNGLVSHGGATTAEADGAIEIVGSPRGVELKDLSIIITNTLTAINFSTAASECLVANCMITNASFSTGGFIGLRTAGIKIDVDPLITGSGIIVENCQIAGFDRGVHLLQGESLVVRNCFIAESYELAGIFTENTGSTGAVISNNIISKIGMGGIYSTFGSDSIFNNIIIGCGNGAIGGTGANAYGNLAIANGGFYDSSVPLQVNDLSTGTSIGEYANIDLL